MAAIYFFSSLVINSTFLLRDQARTHFYVWFRLFVPYDNFNILIIFLFSCHVLTGLYATSFRTLFFLVLFYFYFTSSWLSTGLHGDPAS